MICCICIVSLWPPLELRAEPLKLEQLLEEAVENNRDIAAARKRWEASVARVPLSRVLPDPSIGISVEKVPKGTLKLDRTMPDDRMLTISQFLPLFGKLSLQGKIALVESRMFAAALRNTELDVMNSVRTGYYELFMNERESLLLKESAALLENFARVAEIRLGVGKISQSEVFKIHAEIARLSTALKNLVLRRSAIATRINTLLHRDPHSPLGNPEVPEGVSDAVYLPETLYKKAIENQPELHMLSYAIEKNKFARSLARRSFFPDLMAGIAQRGIASGTIGPWDLMLSFSAPLWFWTKQKYELREAIAGVEEAEAAYAALHDKLMAEISDLYVRIESAKNSMRLSRDALIPVLESSLDASRAAYAAGNGDFFSLVDSQRMLIDAHMEYYRALIDYYIGLSELKRAVGGEVEGVQQ
jgi:outer membrane protein TolC